MSHGRRHTSRQSAAEQEHTSERMSRIREHSVSVSSLETNEASSDHIAALKTPEYEFESPEKPQPPPVVDPTLLLQQFANMMKMSQMKDESDREFRHQQQQEAKERFERELQEKQQQREWECKRHQELMAAQETQKSLEAERLVQERERHRELMESQEAQKIVEHERRTAEYARKDEATAASRKEDRIYRRLQDQRKDKLQALGSFKMGKDLTLYLSKFEKIMSDCGESKALWVDELYPRLPEILCGRIDRLSSVGKSYDNVKSVILDSVGETVMHFGAKLLSFTSESFKSMSADEFVECLSKVIKGMLYKSETVEQCIFTLIKILAVHHIPQSGKEFLETRNPKDIEEFTEAYAGWLNTRQQGNYFYPVSAVAHKPKFNNSSGVIVTCFKCNKPGHRSFECRTRGFGSSNSQSYNSNSTQSNYNSRSQSNSSQEVRTSTAQDGVNNNSVNSVNTPIVSRTFTRNAPYNAAPRRPIRCYTCMQEGHISVYCPTRRTERTTTAVNFDITNRKKNNVIQGQINGVSTSILVDSGADYGLVASSLVKPEQYLGRDCIVTGIHGDPKRYELAECEFTVKGRTVRKRVVVDGSGEPPQWSILPVDLADPGDYLLVGQIMVDGNISVLTRAQALSQERLANDDDAIVTPLLDNDDDVLFDSSDDGRMIEEGESDSYVEHDEESALNGIDVASPSEE